MFAVKRNQVIISALVVMIVVAGYLNYIDTTKSGESKLTYNEMEEQKLADMAKQNTEVLIDETTGQEVMVVNSNNTKEIVSTSDANGEIGIALTYEDGNNTNKTLLSDVNTPATETTKSNEEGKTKTDDNGAVFVNNSSDSSFFIQAKLEREQSRSKEKETLTELINNQNIEKDQKALCATNMLDIQQRIEKETATEALIEAKGFTEAYVRIDANGVDVIVSKSELSDAEIAQIEDIVKRKTGFKVENIKIAPLKAN